MLGLKSLQTATTMIVGIEALHLIKKEQTFQEQKSVQKQIYFIHELLV
ncbi:insertion sequence IS240 protein (plasmid) [Bacillus thuringiensis YBT-1518]|uniref:Insertion sequence IS240 protein n=2 Tax=Bacillus TaxID=1386 RepID=A0A9W3PJV2_BACTU|nr:insertion sequence IS240 protein [Bacillus thuringiensis YBT-1518]AHA75784.1 insertion sequence IS240 protein [Bacillus thuringiensis YBT-1518]